MTRYLSLALGAEEPVFSQSIQQLERAGGAPRADIHLTADMQQRTRAKIAELGLDPTDTTGPELYGVLHERLRHDEAALRAVLEIPTDAAVLEVLEKVVTVIETAQIPKQSFTIKQSVAKRMFKKKPPKQLMKKLGYRSVDSMLKHEPIAQLYAAAVMTEPRSWIKQFYDQYDSLTPSDFEMRNVAVFLPTSRKWQALALEFTTHNRQNIMTFRELAAIVVLPVGGAADGAAIVTALLLLHAMNEIRSFSSYAKLQQVRPDFGQHLREVSRDEPRIATTIAGRAVPWRTIHRFYALRDGQHPEIFEPHVQPEDLTWIQPEAILGQLVPTITFWTDCHDLVLMHDNQPVSYNMLDVALGYYNKLSFKDRVVHFVRDAVWHELTTKYLSRQNFETVLGGQLSYALAEDLPLAES